MCVCVYKKIQVQISNRGHFIWSIRVGTGEVTQRQSGQCAGQLCFRERSSYLMWSPGMCGYSEQDVRYHFKSCYFQTLCTAFYPVIPAHQLLHQMNTLPFRFFTVEIQLRIKLPVPLACAKLVYFAIKDKFSKVISFLGWMSIRDSIHQVSSGSEWSSEWGGVMKTTRFQHFTNQGASICRQACSQLAPLD